MCTGVVVVRTGRWAPSTSLAESERRWWPPSSAENELCRLRRRMLPMRGDAIANRRVSCLPVPAGIWETDRPLPPTTAHYHDLVGLTVNTSNYAYMLLIVVAQVVYTSMDTQVERRNYR